MRRHVVISSVLPLGLRLLALLGSALVSRAAIQFDVFLGYDGITPQAGWFPVVCEIKNDGPPFVGTVELSGGRLSQDQTRRAVVELPTGTLKRFVIPMFSATRSSSTWDARLLDERGKLRAEQPGLQVRRSLAPYTPLLGAVVRTPGGTPTLQPILPQDRSLQPAAARLLPAIFPDNPIVLEGMACLYLNSEKALDLRVGQVKALLAWLHGGGHLVVGVEQISDITATPWLRNILPCNLNDLQTVQGHSALQEWLRGPTWSTNLTGQFRYQRSSSKQPSPAPLSSLDPVEPFRDLPDDPTFELAPMQVAKGVVRDGRVIVAAGDNPLIVTADRDRGRVTLLLFSPEREPFRSWKHLATFWAKLAEVPGELYLSADYRPAGGYSSDGIFGAMLDTRQVHKLPTEWLLVLLIVYLLVIGPLDQYWLKRINRPMLTWITFPTYVVLFSLLIYVIGYKLRAGESEWNELHLVDVLLKADEAELRGQTYASLYSPSNERYALESRHEFAALRNEFVGTWSASQPGEKTTFLQEGDGSVRADVFVPVWTSQLLVSDWWQPAPAPLKVTVAPQGQQWQVKVENRTERNLSNARIVIEDHVVPLGEIPSRQSKTFTVATDQGTPLATFVLQHGAGFESAVQQRQRTFGGRGSGRLDDLPNGSMAASFLSRLRSPQQPGYQQPAYQYSQRQFIAPPGLDLSAVAGRGNAVLLAWATDYAPVKTMRQFTPRRSHQNTLWRVAIPVQSPKSGV